MKELAIVLISLIFVLAFGAEPAHSQQSGAPTAGSPDADTSSGLGEIVVTAQRREEGSQHAAIAMSTISAASLADANVTTPAGLTSLVPALQITDNAGPYSLFYLRGVGSFTGNALSDSAVAFNVDNVYIGRPSSTTGFFYDLDRVEVLNGPQ